MQRPIIFLATADESFYKTALDAILETCHGVRRATDLKSAWRILAGGTNDIALAVIDLDLEQKGLSLLHILRGCEPDFPIIVTGDHELFQCSEMASKIAERSLAKPVSAELLRQAIEALCTDSAVSRAKYLAQGARNQMQARLTGPLLMAV